MLGLISSSECCATFIWAFKQFCWEILLHLIGPGSWYFFWCVFDPVSINTLKPCIGFGCDRIIIFSFLFFPVFAQTRLKELIHHLSALSWASVPFTGVWIKYFAPLCCLRQTWGQEEYKRYSSFSWVLFTKSWHQSLLFQGRNLNLAIKSHQRGRHQRKRCQKF